MPGSSPGMTNHRQRDATIKETRQSALLRRIGLGRRRGRGRRRSGGGRFRGSRLLFHHAHRDDRAFVQQQQRQRERGLADDVGRRQNRGDDEGDHDEITALLAQLLRGDDADPSQQRQDDRQLERDAEREDQRNNQRQIFADLRQQLDLRGFRPGGLLHAQ